MSAFSAFVLTGFGAGLTVYRKAGCDAPCTLIEGRSLRLRPKRYSRCAMLSLLNLT